MAGGEGTRLRPLTSNQPKPMVPIVGKPCMEHIIDLLRRHGIDDIVVTVAYLPQVIRGYFGDGESLGVTLHYSVEETPLGTAGSVKNAEELLDETFLVISGDALCDFDLTAIVAAHKAAARWPRSGLKSVENPLEFGVVIIDEDGRVERFLEKPSWGQVFSDTINTGVYVLEPEVLRERARRTSRTTSPSSCSPTCCRAASRCTATSWRATGRTSATSTSTGRPTSTRSTAASSWSCRASGCATTSISATACSCPSWARSRARPSSATTAKIEPGARIGAYSRAGRKRGGQGRRARSSRSVIDSGIYIGRSARIEGAILGKRVDVRAHAVVNEGVAIGDECSIGSQSVLAPDVKVYPFKTIEAGAAIHSNLIWESRGITTLFGRDGVSGLVNVDITPDVAARIGMAYGTTLARERADRGQPRRQPGLADDQAGADLRLCRDRRATSPTCGWRCRP